MKQLTFGKKGDWTSPQTLVIIILSVLIGMLLLYGVWKIQNQLSP